MSLMVLHSLNNASDYRINGLHQSSDP